MTHSPGPWRFTKSGQIVDVNHRAIARIWNTSKRDQDMANAALIADAPEVRQLYDELCEDMARLAGEYSEVEQALALCVKAIDNLLPGAPKIPCDVGLINAALMTARPLVGDV